MNQMTNVIYIRDQGLWNKLSNLKGYLKVALEYCIPFDKEEKEYKETIRRLVA